MIMHPFLPKRAHWISPQYGKDRTPFLIGNLDGDQQVEGIGLFKQQQRVGLVVIKQEGEQWKQIDQQTFAEEELQLAGVGELTGDQATEVVLSVKKANETEAQTKVFQLKQKKLKVMLEQNTTAAVFDDLDQDRRTDLILFRNLDMYQSEAVLYRAEKQKLKEKQVLPLEGFLEMSMVTVGQVQKGRKGFVADMTIGAHGGKASLFYLEKGKLQDAFYGILDNRQNFRLYNVKSKDINQDGIIDIPFTERVENSENLANAEKPIVYRWYHWGQNNQLELIHQQYEDHLLGIRVHYPAAWKNSKIKTLLDPQTRTITFGLPLPQNHLTPVVIAGISAVKKSAWPSYKQAMDAYKQVGTFEYEVIGERNDVVYLATLYNKKATQLVNGADAYQKAQQSGMVPTLAQLKKWVEIYRDADLSFVDSGQQILYDIQ
jgi:hypothetical protein